LSLWGLCVQGQSLGSSASHEIFSNTPKEGSLLIADLGSLSRDRLGKRCTVTELFSKSIQNSRPRFLLLLELDKIQKFSLGLPPPQNDKRSHSAVPAHDRPRLLVEFRDRAGFLKGFSK